MPNFWEWLKWLKAKSKRKYWHRCLLKESPEKQPTGCPHVLWLLEGIQQKKMKILKPMVSHQTWEQWKYVYQYESCSSNPRWERQEFDTLTGVVQWDMKVPYLFNTVLDYVLCSATDEIENESCHYNFAREMKSTSSYSNRPKLHWQHAFSEQ